MIGKVLALGCATIATPVTALQPPPETLTRKANETPSQRNARLKAEGNGSPFAAYAKPKSMPYAARDYAAKKYAEARDYYAKKTKTAEAGTGVR
jgi:hypothetical protein